MNPITPTDPYQTRLWKARHFHQWDIGNVIRPDAGTGTRVDTCKVCGLCCRATWSTVTNESSYFYFSADGKSVYLEEIELCKSPPKPEVLSPIQMWEKINRAHTWGPEKRSDLGAAEMVTEVCSRCLLTRTMVVPTHGKTTSDYRRNGRVLQEIDAARCEPCHPRPVEPFMSDAASEITRHLDEARARILTAAYKLPKDSDSEEDLLAALGSIDAALFCLPGRHS